MYGANQTLDLLCFQMDSSVLLEVIVGCERFFAHRALMWPALFMNIFNVYLEIRIGCK